MDRLVCFLLLLAVAAYCVPDTFGQDGKASLSAGEQADREAEALAFARLHHPELRDLLDRLKEHNPREFEKAVRQLYLTSERLERIREREPQRYRVDLEFWKVDSRIRLLAARLTMTNDPALEDEIRDLLRERLELRLHQLRLEKDRLANRLERIDETLANLDSDREATVQREFERLKRSLSAPRPKAAPARAAGQTAATKEPNKRDREPRGSKRKQ